MDEDCGNGNELRNTVRNLEESLEKDREESGRPFELGSMSPEQVIQEKQSIQRALNQFKVSFPPLLRNKKFLSQPNASKFGIFYI